MNSLDIDTKNLHHAYLISGKGELVVPIIENFLAEALKYPLQGNPDYVKEAFDLFGVDDGHRINNMQNRRAIISGKKIFVLTCSTFSSEAQSSLLKMFEEPTADTHFFIIVPTLDIVLPTVRSRMMVITSEENTRRKPDFAFAKTFFESNISERLKMMETVTEEKDKTKAGYFLDDIEQYAHEQLKKGGDLKFVHLLSDVVMFRGYLRDRAPSVKMMIEHIVHTTQVR